MKMRKNVYMAAAAGPAASIARQAAGRTPRRALAAAVLVGAPAAGRVSRCRGPASRAVVLRASGTTMGGPQGRPPARMARVRENGRGKHRAAGTGLHAAQGPPGPLRGPGAGVQPREARQAPQGPPPSRDAHTDAHTLHI